MLNKSHPLKMVYDKPKKMNQAQLELAWLGSIYENAEACRKYGLQGLDQSMFRQKFVFETGLSLLRDLQYTNRYHLTDAHLSNMIKHSLHSKLEAAHEAGLFLPGFYEIYCREIETRAVLRNVEKAAWN